MLDAALLGTGGMMPLPDRFLTSLMLRLNGRMMLIDCGEGTQVSARLLGWGFKSIEAICFTHYHADHISGLPGMLLMIGNSGRTQPLHIYGPQGLGRIYDGLSRIAPELPFEVILHEFEKEDTIAFDAAGLEIKAVKAEHKILCYAYSIELKRAGKFDVEKAKANNVPVAVWSRLQKSESCIYDGKTYTDDMVLGKKRKGIKIAYCTDSRPIDRIAYAAEDSDLFICEGMYGDNESRGKAIDKKHMIFSEAAELARKANAKKMWLTHYSPSLTKPEDFIENAREIFNNSYVGYDRLTESIMFEE